MAQVFNSKVSIITKSEIRYEGTIYQINPQQQTIALKDVRSFGTEGRRPDHEIPPNQQSYDILVFKAAEIKGFKTLEENKSEDLKLENVKQENQSQQVQHFQPPQNIEQIEQQQEQRGQFQNYFPQNQQIKSNGTNPRAFNFEEMLQKANEIEKIKKQEVKPKYNPTSFFDSLSTSTQKQERSTQQRNQNQIDTDTFGNFYKQRQHNNNNNNNGQRRNNNNNNNNNNYNKNNNKNYRRNNNDQQRVVYVEKQSLEQYQQQSQQSQQQQQ
ncbi:unnamed protein product [Paramecium primaurelia]|uniref:Lsm14-like N-terminal domain-containing protein n=2 Tax=Paramecium TaxID=5884 RepID=A0A8S1W2H8_9CILI|nr:unnamed protein product [Paramecium primaurelia]CAD8184214.1 unnamed protein product [Paramecium pentaurelia]